jgi:hypothetical protein
VSGYCENDVFINNDWYKIQPISTKGQLPLTPKRKDHGICR